jgi:transposase
VLVIAANVPIYVALDPVDMRKSFDALALCVREQLGHDPQCGALYVFAGKSGTRIKVLWFHQNGYCLLYKRLHRAVFRLPKGVEPSASSVEIDLLELGKILDGIALSASKRAIRRVSSTMA